ncbi:MAG: efflux RND transporter periplasmic adaptor subunit [Motiliproteus sp.]|nr:efflux RND transporter periplasmic adaptor subunit [Motiliproteus sp.]MCW9052773.1 efflux RND transporter periplasmic adaptor subunit [Motiliproteus sp.]
MNLQPTAPAATLSSTGFWKRITAISLLTGLGIFSPTYASDYVHQAEALTLKLQAGYQIPRLYVGKVQVNQDTALGFEQPGKLIDLHVEEGDLVRQGQVLAKQDTQLLVVEAKQLHARLLEVKARQKLNQADLKRIQQLTNTGYASVQQLDQLRSQREVLIANAQQIRTTLAANQLKQDKSVLIAPFDAVVSQRLVDNGEVLVAGKPVFELLKADSSEVKVGVPVALLSKLPASGLLNVEVANTHFQGRLLSTGAKVDPLTRTVALRISLPKQGNFVDGQLAYLHIDEHFQQPGYWIPLASLTDGIRGLWNVYNLAPLPHGNLYSLQARNVTIVHATDTHAYVTGAITDGERILAKGLHRLVIGQQVRLTASR